MDFSDQWRSLFSISSVFAAPNLAGATLTPELPFDPLAFRPSSPPLTILSSPSLAFSLPAPAPSRSNAFKSLRAIFPSEISFLPSSLHRSLLPDVVAALQAPPVNNLHSLLCRDGRTLLLFFPSGDNANIIGFLTVSFPPGAGAAPVLGPINVKRLGFKRQYHRITKLALAPASNATFDPKPSDRAAADLLTEGFLIAITMYSCNWFRIKLRVSSGGVKTPTLIPMGTKKFQIGVIHACWNPHFPAESAVLLESGELYWFNLKSKSAGVVRVAAKVGTDSGHWLSCEYGGQPWTVIAASSTAVFMVDLRSREGEESRVLVRMDEIRCFFNRLHSAENDDEILHTVENDKILAFCKAGFDDFQISVATNQRLLLFDTRQPMAPVLTWDHGINHPSFVAMFRLCELRPSDRCKWASQSGFSILLGSFLEDDFSLFCYGPGEKGGTYRAWELPSLLSLSGKRYDLADELVRELFVKENSSYGMGWRPKIDMVVGFCIIPHEAIESEPKSVKASGFTLIRLMLSGKLEIQEYDDASLDSSSKVDCDQANTLSSRGSSAHYKVYQEDISRNFTFLKLRYITGYLNGRLRGELPELSLTVDEAYDNLCVSKDLIEAINDMQTSFIRPVSKILQDNSVPRSIFEIAFGRALSSLSMDILPLAFSKISEHTKRFENSPPSELLVVPRYSPHIRGLPFLTRRPENIYKKHPPKGLLADALVGPMLPLPVLLSLQQINAGNGKSAVLDEDSDAPLNTQCKMVRETVYPEVSLSADTENCTAWNASQESQNDGSFFIYEPTFEKSTQLETNCPARSTKEDMPQKCPAVHGYINDDCFSTFVCGFTERFCSPKSDEELASSDIFNISPISLDFDQSRNTFSPDEHKYYRHLKRQFSKWLGDYKPYQELCSSSKLPKLEHDVH